MEMPTAHFLSALLVSENSGVMEGCECAHFEMSAPGDIVGVGDFRRVTTALDCPSLCMEGLEANEDTEESFSRTRISSPASVWLSSETENLSSSLLLLKRFQCNDLLRLGFFLTGSGGRSPIFLDRSRVLGPMEKQQFRSWGEKCWGVGSKKRMVKMWMVDVWEWQYLCHKIKPQSTVPETKVFVGISPDSTYVAWLPSPCVLSSFSSHCLHSSPFPVDNGHIKQNAKRGELRQLNLRIPVKHIDLLRDSCRISRSSRVVFRRSSCQNRIFFQTPRAEDEFSVCA